MTKTAIVTGGSSGIGYALCEQLARDGYRVHMLARDPQRGLAATARIRAAVPAAEVEFIACDVRSMASVKSALATVESHVDSADLLVNCAGVLHRARLGDASEDAIDAQLDTSLKGTILVTGAALDLLARAESALVVNLGSAAGREPFEGLTAYGAAKGGVIQFSRAAAKELYGRGIRVICVNPGVVQTGLMSAAELALVQSTLPGRRLQQPEEVASFIVSLAGGGHSALTGAIIDLDDGAGLFTGGPTRVDGAPRLSTAGHDAVSAATPATAERAGVEPGEPGEPGDSVTAMPGGDLAARLAGVFERVFGLAASAVHPDLTPDDVFKWDSIGHIRLVGAIEEEMGVSFDVDEIMELTSVRAILEIVGRKV